jgi:hypothetical protein
MENDPRLTRICTDVIMGTTEKIISSLEKHKFVEPIPGINDWQLCGPLTPRGFNLISDALIVGIEYVFQKSRIDFPPSINIDEKYFADYIVKKSGIPKILTINNQIDIIFPNPRNSPVIFIRSYLDPDKENPLPCTIKELKISRSGLVFTNLKSSCN